ncbi:hypothetical protein VTK56DRAFT_7071 [Thermocarpiscus australiensis]
MQEAGKQVPRSEYCVSELPESELEQAPVCHVQRWPLEPVSDMRLADALRHHHFQTSPASSLSLSLALMVVSQEKSKKSRARPNAFLEINCHGVHAEQITHCRVPGGKRRSEALAMARTGDALTHLHSRPTNHSSCPSLAWSTRGPTANCPTSRDHQTNEVI